MEKLDPEFGARIREAIGDESVNAFAKRCELPEATLRGYLKGKYPTADKALRIAETSGVTVEWLIAGRGPSRMHEPDLVIRRDDGAVMMIEAKRLPGSSFALIPRLDIQASAGNGRVALHEEPLEYLAFQADWLRGRGINPGSARILTARGDSMEETIRDGDILLVDTSIDRVRDNSIYVVIYGDMVLVKRIHGRINGSLQLISDNPRYPPEEVSAAEVDQLNIAGRVMWFGRSI